MDPDLIDSSAHTIGLVIQLAIAPIFLLVGTGSFLNVMTVRLGRVVDRVRSLESLIDGGETGEERRRHLAELHILDRRMILANGAITCCSSAALFICFVVALLFFSEFTQIDLRVPVAGLFILSMASLITGLVLFLGEITIATRSLRVRNELIKASTATDEGPDYTNLS